MKFKSIFSFTLSLSIGLLVFVGCSAAKVNNLNLATGGVSGTYYPFGGAMAQIWNTNIDNMNVTAQATGASAENIRLISKKEADLGIVQNDVMSYAFEGIESFEGEKIEGFNTIATLYPEVVQIVAGTDINSIADLKGKRVSIGDAGSGVESNAKQILSAYGITYSDIKVNNLSFKESASAYQDGQLDAFFVTAGIPNSAIQEVALQRPIKILSIEDKIAEELINNYPFYVNFVIPADTYSLSEDINTVAVKATLIVGSYLSDDTVYNLTKTLFEKQPEIAAAHAKGELIDINEAIKGASVPFHPGALKYYSEKGVK